MTQTFKQLLYHYKNGSLKQVLSNIIRKPANLFNKKYPGLIERDLYNKLKYGISAPINHELIWVNPKEIRQVLVPAEVKRITGKTRTYTSGLVIDWNEVKHIKPLHEEFKIQYCINHWREGVPWDEMGVLEFLKTNSRKHRRKSDEEISERFNKLDEAFKEVKKEGRLKTRKEIDPANYREQDGILVHIGRDGEPFFGSCGNHRLAMALVLDFNKIPAWIGLVDKDSIKYLDKYREPPLNELK